MPIINETLFDRELIKRYYKDNFPIIILILSAFLIALMIFSIIIFNSPESIIYLFFVGLLFMLYWMRYAYIVKIYERKYPHFIIPVTYTFLEDHYTAHSVTSKVDCIEKVSYSDVKKAIVKGNYIYIIKKDRQAHLLRNQNRQLVDLIAAKITKTIIKL